MAGPTTYPSAKVFVGGAKETTPGTAVAPTFTFPMEKFEGEDKPTPLIDKAMRGSMVEEYGYIQGVVLSEWTASGPWFGDMGGYLFSNILGDLTTTGGAAPFSHAFSLLNSGTAQPGTLTWTQWQGLPATNQARQYAGSCLSELTLKGNAETELITWDAKGLGWMSTIAAAIPTSSPTTAQPMAAWRSTLGLGGPATGGTQDKTIGSWEIKITRKLKAFFTGQNSQNPYIIQRGAVTGTGKLAFAVPADESHTQLYLLNNTQPQFQWVITNAGVGAALLSLQVDVQAAAYDTGKPNYGAEAIGYDATFKAIANTTNAGASGGYSPFKITLQNAITAGTY
jgi:hypothetical protein